ncbi:hypothetical protein Drorol1_Dr00001613 [Drosera rotundifolia]
MNNKKVVCVTGASGYIASWIVKLLLFHNLHNLVALAELCSVVFNGRPLGPEVIVDETWFSDPDYCKKIKNWYYLSKTLAEDKAWKFAKANSINLISINPLIVIGPLLQPTLNRTIEDILDLIRATTYPNSVGAFVNVRDVANAHIQALEIPSTNGRYRVVESVFVIFILIFNFPPSVLMTYLWFQQLEFQKERFKSLGITEFIPLKLSLKDTVESLKDKLLL